MSLSRRGLRNETGDNNQPTCIKPGSTHITACRVPDLIEIRYVFRPIVSKGNLFQHPTRGPFEKGGLPKTFTEFAANLYRAVQI